MASVAILCSQGERPHTVIGAEARDPERSGRAVLVGRGREERGTAIAAAPLLVAESGVFAGPAGWALACVDVGHGGVHPRPPACRRARAFEIALRVHDTDVARQAPTVELLLQHSALGLFRERDRIPVGLGLSDVHRTRGVRWRSGRSVAARAGGGAAAAAAAAAGTSTGTTGARLEVCVDDVHLCQPPIQL